MELFIILIITMFFVFICKMGKVLLEQNDQLRKDLKNAYQKLNELQK